MSFTFKPVPEIVIFALLPTVGAMLKVCEKVLFDCAGVAFSTELDVPPAVPDVAFAPPVVADGAPAELLTLPAVELLTLPDVAPEVVALLDEVLLDEVLLLDDEELLAPPSALCAGLIALLLVLFEAVVGVCAAAITGAVAMLTTANPTRTANTKYVLESMSFRIFRKGFELREPADRRFHTCRLETSTIIL